MRVEAANCSPALLPMASTISQQQQHHARRATEEENDVLQFLLGAAPLSSKSLSLPTTAAIDSHQRSSDVLAAEDPESAPLLEYASDVESEDDYLVGCELVGSPMDDLLRIPSGEDAVASEFTPTRNVCESAVRGALSPVVEEPEEMAVEKTGGSQCASDSPPNDTDSDGNSSQSEHCDVYGLHEVEEEPPELSTVSVAIVKGSAVLDAARMNAEDECASASKNTNDDDRVEQQGSSDIRAPSSRVNVLSRREVVCKTRSGDSESVLPTASEDSASNKTRTAAGLNNASNGIEKPRRYDPPPPTRAEFLFVGTVTAAISLYVVATIYAYFHPIFLPLPALSSLQSPVDLARMGISISEPTNHSLMPQPLFLNWTLINYPADAIETFGPEVFQYRIFVNGKRVASEIGILSVDDDSASVNSLVNDRVETVAIGDEPIAFVNKTVRQRIPSQFVSEFMSYEILVEVTMVVPGSEGDTTSTIVERVFVVNAVKVARRLELIAPKPGSVFSKDQPVVVSYATAHVHRLDVVLDGTLLIAKRHIGDGSLLLRGLGIGRHTITLVGYDAAGERIPSKRDGDTTTTIEIIG